MVRTQFADAEPIKCAPGHDHAAVQLQLARILESPHFRNSKRSQSLLRFVVEMSLAGDSNSLKERYIGATVFGREAAYDTAQDPIVRNAAIDVRKRLAQYYMHPEHASELRIELPSGSYQPTILFEAPAVIPQGSESTLEVLPLREPAAPEPARPQVAGRIRIVWKGALALAVLGLVAAAGNMLWQEQRTADHELNAFWEPLFRASKTIQICIGQPTRVYRFTGPRSEELNRALGHPSSPERDAAQIAVAPGEIAWVAPEYLFLRDAMAGFNVASWVQSRGHPLRLMSVAQTNYSLIRHEPLVTIGAFNNAWAIRVTADLRFVFDQRTVNGVTYHCITDRRHPEFADWKVAQPAGASMTEDYAIVTRVLDPATEQIVISAAGIEAFGTLSASDFVTKPEYVGVALQSAPKDWRRRNAQFVLGTRIIDGAPGPPKVLAAHFW